MHAKSRPAVVGEKLETKSFGRGTIGFAAVGGEKDAYDNPTTAVCLLPGTEVAFAEPVKVNNIWDYVTNTETVAPKQLVARFRQINKEDERTHHDALEFADGEFILLTRLSCDQVATVLQLPAAPKTAAEAKEQERLPVTA